MVKAFLYILREVVSGFSRTLFLLVVFGCILWQSYVAPDVNERDFFMIMGSAFGVIAILAVFELLMILMKVINHFDRKRVWRRASNEGKA